jgi:predicted Fe-Mo cluster-binding NifX family protein
MKIALPIDEKSIESPVSLSFGRAPYFLLYSPVTQEAAFFENTAAASHGGAGIKAAQFIADHGANVLLAPRCGENAGQVLTKAEVLVYQTMPGTAKQNIDAYIANQLNLHAGFHPGFHGKGK